MAVHALWFLADYIYYHWDDFPGNISLAIIHIVVMVGSLASMSLYFSFISYIFTWSGINMLMGNYIIQVKLNQLYGRVNVKRGMLNLNTFILHHTRTL